MFINNDLLFLIRKIFKKLGGKKMKKLLTLAISVIALALVLTSCYPAILNTTMEVNLDGSGTRTFVVELLKDGETNPDDSSDTVAGMFTNPGYFPQGIDPAVAYLNTLRPACLSPLVATEETDRYVVTFKMEFDSIDDFNTKMHTLTEDLDWDEEGIVEATLTSVVGDTTTSYTYTEDVLLVNIGSLWMSYALWDSPQDTTEVTGDEIFNVAYAQSMTNWEKHYSSEQQTAMFFTNATTIDLNGVKETFGEDSEEVTVTAVFNNPTEAPVESDPVSKDESPQTSEGFPITMIAVISLIAVGATLLLVQQKSSVK